jgi:hypothetical protein
MGILNLILELKHEHVTQLRGLTKHLSSIIRNHEFRYHTFLTSSFLDTTDLLCAVSPLLLLFTRLVNLLLESILQRTDACIFSMIL